MSIVHRSRRTNPMPAGWRPGRPGLGFTLIELMVVMAIVATLLSLVAPRYMHSVDRAKEAALRTNLRVLRSALDQHYADTGAYPGNIDRLVANRYLREIPVDPLTERADTWKPIEHPGGLAGVYDIRSGAAGAAIDGTQYASW